VSGTGGGSTSKMGELTSEYFFSFCHLIFDIENITTLPILRVCIEYLKGRVA
jgi:hypothetical protein